MSTDQLLGQAQRYLDRLCREIGGRAVGSAGNRAATAFFAEMVVGFSWETERQVFECMDWRDEGASLHVGGVSFAVSTSPYSRGVSAEAPLVSVDTDEALAAAEVRDRVLLLHGDIAREQLMPRNFPFYNPERHQKLLALLERGAPRALVCATGRNPELAGGLYPFPLIEDGDFDIPSVTMTDVEGRRLLPFVGQTVALESRAERVAAHGENVIAHRGDGGRPIVICAHIDAKMGTPGAIDNGSGVVVLLLLAQLLTDYGGDRRVEIVALNGEDYYNAPGQQLYLAQKGSHLEEIALVINLDGVGFHRGKTAYSLYGCGEDLSRVVRRAFDARDGFIEGPAWYQGDHAIFVQQGIAAAALTSEHAGELSARITHTAKDTPDIVDCTRLVETARALQAIVLALGEPLSHRPA